MCHLILSYLISLILFCLIVSFNSLLSWILSIYLSGLAHYLLEPDYRTISNLSIGFGDCRVVYCLVFSFILFYHPYYYFVFTIVWIFFFLSIRLSICLSISLPLSISLSPYFISICNV